MTKRTVYKLLRVVVVLIIGLIGSYQINKLEVEKSDNSTASVRIVNTPAGEALTSLEIKGRAPKTGYKRTQFGDGWLNTGGCDTRNRILTRDLSNVSYVPTIEPIVCKVASGTLVDPYSGQTIAFSRGEETSDDVQIDHVVALSDAWQKGAQQLSFERRVELANDPLELLAVDGGLNQQKSDGDAATWLPPHKPYRCAYVARQIAVKKKYSLWVTRSEYDTMAEILATCPGQTIPTI